MTRTAVSLAKVLRELGLLEDGEQIVIYRTRSGYRQRALGAWRWWCETATEKGRREVCGSQWTVAQCIEFHKGGDGLVLSYDQWGFDCALVPIIFSASAKVV